MKSKRDNAFEGLQIYHDLKNGGQEALERLKNQSAGAFLVGYSSNRQIYCVYVKNGDGTVKGIPLNESDQLNLNFHNYDTFMTALNARIKGQTLVTPFERSDYENSVKSRNRP